MSIRSLLALWFCVVTAGCALLPEPEEEVVVRAVDLESFARVVREDLQAHAWQSLLALSDPVHYRNEVVLGGTPEPLYLAELFGLTERGNRIQEGDTLEWEDLERIGLVTFAPVGDDDSPYRYRGLATLMTGEQLRLEAWATQVRGRYVLTPAPAGAR